MKLIKKYRPQIVKFLKEFFERGDMLLLGLCLAASIFGIIVISSATASYPNTLKYVLVQTLALIIGLGLYAVFTVLDVEILGSYWKILLGAAVFMILLLIPFGTGDSEVGNRGWIRFMGIGVQPSEIVKVIYIILMAKHINYIKTYKNLDHFFSIVQLGVHFMLFFGLIVVVSDDLGSALIFAFIFIMMLFAAGIKLYWFAIGAAGVAAIAPFAWNHVLNDYQKDRIMLPYDPTIDPKGDGIGWQMTQSMKALASGQFNGQGLFNGTQTQKSLLPEKENDFIFAVIGEELGLVGCTIAILLLVAIIARCLYIGIRSNNTMNMLVCFGVAGSVIFQTFENIGMCIGLTPIIGITLPFFSYGGSSTVAMMSAMGLVSGVRYRPRPERFVTMRY